MSTQRKLQLVSGVGNARDGATQLEETLKRLQRQVTIRSGEGYKTTVSLKAKYSDHFEQGARMRSVSLDGPVWQLSCRFMESSLSIASLQVVVIFLYRTEKMKFIVRYHITDRECGITFKPYPFSQLPDDIFEQKDGWLKPDIHGDPRYSYDGKPTVMFSPRWFFLLHREDTSQNVFPVIATFFDRVRRNVEHHGRYNFLFRVGAPSKHHAQTVSIEELDDALDNQ